MNLYIKVGTAKSGKKYHAIFVERFGIEKAVSFDIEVILLISGLSMQEVYTLPLGNHKIKI